VDSLDRVIISSRGPAYDGRIKPEIVAFGQEAPAEAAIVSGLAAILERVYLELFQDPYPPAELIKAILINTAKDIEKPGPDYISGFGSVRAYEAVRTIEERWFRLDSVGAADTNEFVITLPGNATNLKATLAWADPGAMVFANKALVHDLDLRIIPEGTPLSTLPWVLNAFPHSDFSKIAHEDMIRSIRWNRFKSDIQLLAIIVSG
jgi:hypothetical protein